MKLYIAPRAPNPRRVQMFMHEKNLPPMELVPVDINAGEHRDPAFRAKNPVSRVPVLELDDGRLLSETRAICSYLEGIYPDTNLMGVDFEERAFIEMHDRRVEWYWLMPIAATIRHTHPGLAPLEQPQFPDFGPLAGRQGARGGALARRHPGRPALDRWRALHHRRHHGLLRLRVRAWADEVQGRRRGLCRLQAWRDRMAARPSAAAW
jgi:glutathione S-transferase